MKPVELSGDVVAGASALAGLFLVYLGNATTAFSAFEKTQQESVRGNHQTRAWLAVVGTSASTAKARDGKRLTQTVGVIATSTASFLSPTRWEPPA
jgi:hypothetical protein